MKIRNGNKDLAAWPRQVQFSSMSGMKCSPVLAPLVTGCIGFLGGLLFFNRNDLPKFGTPAEGCNDYGNGESRRAV